MEGKAMGMLVAFAAIVLCAGALTYYLEVESKRQDLATSTRILTDNKGHLAGKIALRNSADDRLAAAQAKLDAAKGRHDTLEDLTKSKEELTAAVAALEAEKKAATTGFIEAVQRLRSESAGTPWPDITLPNGQVYQKVVFQKVGDTEISISHAAGLAKISATDLPADLKQRFRYGMFPMIPSAEVPASKDSSNADSSPAPAAPPAAAAANESKVREGNEKAAAAVDDQIAALRVQMESLKKSRTSWAAQATQHRNLGIDARDRGRPSAAFFASAAADDQQVAVIDQQIKAINTRIGELAKIKGLSGRQF